VRSIIVFTITAVRSLPGPLSGRSLDHCKRIPLLSTVAEVSDDQHHAEGLIWTDWSYRIASPSIDGSQQTGEKSCR
jgi:hypothetical protein